MYHLDSAFKACDLGAVFLLEQYALEIKYSEGYADEAQRGKTIQRFDWGCRSLINSPYSHDDTINREANKLFMAWVEREVIASSPKYYETWHNSLPSDEKLKYRSSPYDPCAIRFNNGN